MFLATLDHAGLCPLQYGYMEDTEYSKIIRRESLSLEELAAAHQRMLIRINTLCKGLLECRGGATDPWKSGTNVDMKAMIDTSVYASHRTVIEFLRLPATNKRLSDSAGTDSDARRASYCKSCTALLQAQYLMGLTVRSYKTTMSLQGFDRQAEVLPFHMTLPLWTDLERVLVCSKSSPREFLLNQMLYEVRSLRMDSHKIRDLIGQSSLESNFSALLASSGGYGSRYVQSRLESNPALLVNGPKGLPPLFALARSGYPTDEYLRMLRVLLELGANPNLSFVGTTPWEVALTFSYSFCNREMIIHKGENNFVDRRMLAMSRLFIEYGADLEKDCNLTVLRINRDRVIILDAHDMDRMCLGRKELPRPHRSYKVPAKALVRYLCRGAGDPVTDLIPVDEELEDTEVITERITEELRSIEKSDWKVYRKGEEEE